MNSPDSDQTKEMDIDIESCNQSPTTSAPATSVTVTETFSSDSATVFKVPTEKDTLKKRTFHSPCGSDELEDLSKWKFAVNTERKIKWVLGIYCQWCEHKLADKRCDIRICKSDIHFPSKLQLTDMAYSLRMFLTEARKLDSSEYPPRTLYQMILCIQMFFEKHKVFWKLLGKGDECLTDLYYTLDNLMKKHTGNILVKA